MRRRHFGFPLAVAWATLSAAAAAGQLHVDPSGAGGAHPTLQGALDASLSGDVIVVHGGTYVAVTIAKPVTIVGSPRPLIRPPLAAEAGWPDCDAAITLAGTGAGTVALVDVDIGGLGAADWFSIFHPAIEGGGFLQLRLEGCSVGGPDLVSATGLGVGAPAIATSVPLLWITGSIVTGGENTTDVACTPMPTGPVAIDAPHSTVVVLDSIVAGGNGSDGYACFDTFCGVTVTAQPCPCAALGGFGGAGIRAQRAYVANSAVVGGAGMGVLSACDDTGIPWGVQPSGAPYAATTTVVSLPNDLVLKGTLKTGGSANLVWTGGTSQLMLVSTAPSAPQPSPVGTWFADPSGPLIVQPIADGIASTRLAVPAAAALIGTSLVVQVFDPTHGLTRPAFDVVRP